MSTMRLKIFLTLFLIFGTAFSQSRKTLALNFNYVISAFVYPNVISSDRALRDFSNEINNWFGFSGDFKYEVTEGYFVGLSIESVDKTISDYLIRRVGNANLRIPIEDRYTIYIAELSAFFVAPFSSQKWQIYIGGGIGAYKGNFSKSILNLKSKIQKSPVNLGIHVMSGVQFNFTEKIGLKGELKFRDPIVEVESKFTDNQINYNGYIIQIDPSPFRTRVNFDTMTFVLGLVFSF